MRRKGDGRMRVTHSGAVGIASAMILFFTPLFVEWVGMITKTTKTEWFIFFEDLGDHLKAHFDAGGTIDMLTGSEDACSAIYHCCNENAERCLPLMIQHGAKPDRATWAVAFRNYRPTFIETCIACNYWPPRSLVYGLCTDMVTSPLCKKAVFAVLCAGRNNRSRPPWRDLWKLIAHTLWATRAHYKWLDCLPPPTQ